MSTKRQAWEALQRECPEFVPSIREIAKHMGISGVTVQAGGEVVQWGNVEGHEDD